MTPGGGEEFNVAEFLAALQAEEDQTSMALAHLARTVGIYWMALRQIGFDHTEAFELARDYQQGLIDSHIQGLGEDD